MATWPDDFYPAAITLNIAAVKVTYVDDIGDLAIAYLPAAPTDDFANFGLVFGSSDAAYNAVRELLTTLKGQDYIELVDPSWNDSRHIAKHRIHQFEVVTDAKLYDPQV